jgi:hypothetical protein
MHTKKRTCMHAGNIEAVDGYQRLWTLSIPDAKQPPGLLHVRAGEHNVGVLLVSARCLGLQNCLPVPHAYTLTSQYAPRTCIWLHGTARALQATCLPEDDTCFAQTGCFENSGMMRYVLLKQAAVGGVA